MNEQSHPENPYRRMPPPPTCPPAPGSQFRGSQVPGSQVPGSQVPASQVPASFGGQLGAIAKDATLSAARVAADRLGAAAQNPGQVGDVVGKAGRAVSAALLSFGVAVGAIFVLAGLTMTGDSVLYGLGGVLIGLAFVLPCAWPLVCRGRDRKAVAAWEAEQARNRELASYLTEEDALVARALAPTPRPDRVARRWGKVGTATGVVAVLGLALIVAGSDAYEAANPGVFTEIDDPEDD